MAYVRPFKREKEEERSLREFRKTTGK